MIFDYLRRRKEEKEGQLKWIEDTKRGIDEVKKDLEIYISQLNCHVAYLEEFDVDREYHEDKINHYSSLIIITSMSLNCLESFLETDVGRIRGFGVEFPIYKRVIDSMITAKNIIEEPSYRRNNFRRLNILALISHPEYPGSHVLEHQF